MSLVVLPRALVVDVNGTPRIGAKAHFYLPATETPITVYTTASYAVAHANPVESVAGGLFPAVYIAPAVNPTFKLVVTDSADTPIYTDDNIPALGFTQGDAGQLLNPRTDAENAAGVTPANYSIPSHEQIGDVIVDRYGINTTPGTTDMFAAETAAQAVIAQLPAGGKVRYLNGSYYSSDTVVVRTQRTMIEGAGKHATTWSFNPASSKSRFELQANDPGDVLFQCGVRRGCFTGSGSQQKIGIDAYDVSEPLFEELAFRTWWGNGGNVNTPSIGIRTAGREAVTFRQIDNYSDRPFHITRNANFPSLSADHYHFVDIIAAANVSTEACILIDGDVGMSSFTAEGYLALIGGKYGIRYLDGTEPAVALCVKIQQLRYEQPADNTGYAIDWNCGTKEFLLDTCNLGGIDSVSTNGGLRARNVGQITLLNTVYTGFGEALNLDNCECLMLMNSINQDTSTVTLTGMEEVFSLPGISSIQPTFPVSYWFRTASGRKNIRINGCETAYFSTTLADDATLALTSQVSGAIKAGFVTVAVYSSTGPIQEGGTWLVTGSGATKISGTTNTVSTDTDANLCLIWTSVSNIVVKNRLGQTVDIVVQEAWKR